MAITDGTIYGPSTLGTASNQITFNQIGSSPYYRMKLRQATRRELREYDIDIPEALGIADFESFIGKSYFLIDGVMYPTGGTATYYTGRQALRKLSSLIIEQADAGSDQGYVPYTWTENGVGKQINLKVMYVDLPENTRGGLKQPFRLLCKIKYPAIVSQSSVSTTIGSSTATITGSSKLAFKLPIVLGATTYTSNGSATNSGDMDTFPTIQIFGPVNIPRITNSTTGEYIELNVNLLASSDSIIVSYDSDSLSVAQAGNTVLGNLTSASTLFKIKPGVNNFTLTGSSVGTGAYATVAFQSAWPLS